jgi:hypothetical protein
MAVASSAEVQPEAARPPLPARVAQSSIPGIQDARAVKILRLGVGSIGILLPIVLIVGNWIVDWQFSWPSSMSGSYYTHTRNLFVGLLCALGVFLIFYWPTWLQGLFTCFAGICALLVAFDPTAPPPGKGSEPAWINYMHHSAAGGLILVLGLFCFVLQWGDAASVATLDPHQLQQQAIKTRPQVPLRRSILYFTCGGLILVSGGFALITGVWPTSWSTGWSSLYLFEAIAVLAFGIVWITAAAVSATTIQKRVYADLERTGHQSAAVTALANLVALPWPAGSAGRDQYAAELRTIMGADRAAAPQGLAKTGQSGEATPDPIGDTRTRDR